MVDLSYDYFAITETWRLKTKGGKETLKIGKNVWETPEFNPVLVISKEVFD